jgi:hypothetical protein
MYSSIQWKQFTGELEEAVEGIIPFGWSGDNLQTQSKQKETTAGTGDVKLKFQYNRHTNFRG